MYIDMLCKDNMANLNYTSRICNTKHIPFFFFLKKITKTTYHEMHECNAMQILKAKKTNNKTPKEERSQRVLR